MEVNDYTLAFGTLIRLLEEKGILTAEEFMEKLEEVKREVSE